ncbi:hypothetical protein C8F04DRAFT_1247215 [Mycena alexandri]|uniref:Uncharacterized protein n=1 Tax=Mycena alexandri TaxID=1745969 RepID=A0AAD6TL37_9AGAR|nr:hypothetical protein C8F04DRAFT_1247215 [Mycena alexandri]
MTVYSPRIVSAELDLQPAGSRWRLLTDLNLTLDDDEATAETLLKAFDLSLHDCGSKPRFDDVSTQNERTQDSFTELPPPTSQNPFLSTPMRLKHFSRLSPSILRDLLRSPSLRSPSLCDDSLDSAPNSNDFAYLGSPVRANVVSLDRLPSFRNANAESDLQSRRPSLPLTPPPSARIPFLNQLSNHAFGKRWTLLLIELLLPVCFTAFRRQEIDPAAHAVFPAMQQPSPSAFRNFQRVIDEMRGVDSAQEVPRFEENHSVLSLSSEPLSQTRAFEPTANTPDIFHDSPPAMNRTLGTLEDEFVNLLQERAGEEEEDAKELRALADRLERIARGRRHLADRIVDRKDEQQKLESKQTT